MSLDSDMSDRAATLQEAVDKFVHTFEHPQTLDLHYESEGQEKQTAITVDDGDDAVTYELRFDGSEDENEPALRFVSE